MATAYPESQHSVTAPDDTYVDAIRSAALNIIQAAGCCDNERQDIQSKKLTDIIVELLCDHSDDMSEISWLAADRFVTEHTNGCGGG